MRLLEHQQLQFQRQLLHKISVTKQGDYTYKGYHILELEINGELWGIYFPCYELMVFEEITGLKAE